MAMLSDLAGPKPIQRPGRGASVAPPDRARSQRRSKRRHVFAFALVSTACGGDPASLEPTGSIRVTTVVEGNGGDPDGVTIVLTRDGGGDALREHVALGGTVAFERLEPGRYVVTAEDVTTLCAIVPAVVVEVADERQDAAMSFPCLGDFFFDLTGSGGREALYVDLSGSVDTLAAGGVDRTWSVSADGTRVLVLHTTANGLGTKIVNLTGGELPVQAIDDCTTSLNDVRWSPNDSVLLGREAGPSCPGAETRIVLYDAETGIPIRIVAAGDSVVGADWAPDGDQIVVLMHQGFYVRSVDEEGITRRAAVPVEGTLRTVQWSPDGGHLLLASAAPAELVVVDAATGLEAARTPLARSATVGVWHPDGSTITYVGDTPSRSTLFSLDLSTGGEVPLLPNFDEWALWPSWSHDGTKLLFVGRRALFVLEAGSTMPRVLVSPPVDRRVAEGKWRRGSSYPR